MTTDRAWSRLPSFWLLSLVAFLLTLLPQPLGAKSAGANLLVNSSFENFYAARRVSETDVPVPQPFRALPGYQGAPFMPSGWSIVPGKDGQGVVHRVRDEGKPALRIRTADGESVSVYQRLVEFVPGANYTLGLSVRGSGRVRMVASAEAPGPWQPLCDVAIQATGEWKPHTASASVGWHRHLGQYTIVVENKADVLVREASISAESEQPNAAAALGKKYVKDGQTIFYEDFDGPTCSIKLSGQTKLTDKDGGRFGRGLTTSFDNGGLTAPLEIGPLPEKGTVEFWFKPAALPTKRSETYRSILQITTQSAKVGNGRLRFMDNCGGCLMLAFHHAAHRGGSEQAYTDRGSAWGWWQTNTWHHLAGTWDGQALRFYVDGVLEGITYAPGMEMPQGQTIDLVLPYAGVIDEIRISRGLRYAPVMPLGASPIVFATPPPVSSATPQPAAQAVKELTPADIAAQRAKMISPLPATDAAACVLGPDKFAPAWEGMPGLKVAKDGIVPGVDALLMDTGTQIGRAAVCKLDKIEAGDYYLGLLVESREPYFRTEYGPGKLLVAAWVNGWPVRFSTTSEPVQVRPGLWLAELQAAGPVALKSGDEIAICPPYSGEPQKIVRLALYRKEPVRGHGVTGRTFGLEGNRPQRLRLVIEPELRGTGMDGDEHTASIRVANPLPYAVDADVTYVLADYFGAPLEQKTETIHVEPHKVWSKAVKFTAKGSQRAYQLDVRTKPAKDFKLPVTRPLEWLEFNDYTRVEFLPNMPDPLTVWNHVRKDLASDKSSGRKALLLDGDGWQIAPLESRRVPQSVPANLAFQPRAVPGDIGRLTKAQFGMWYRKKFRVPEWMQAKDCLLTMRAGQEATVFLNGKDLGCYFGRTTGACDVGLFEVPQAQVAKAIKTGEDNELVLCLRGGISTVNEAFVDQYNADDGAAVQENMDRYGLYPYIVNLETVTLRTAPPVRVKESLVIPDVEKKQLRLFTRIRNEDSQPHNVTLKFELQQLGREVKAQLPEKTVTVEPGAVKEVFLESPAGELAEYTNAKPVLAMLTTMLAEGDKPIDRFDQRFGYRSLRVQGTGLLLNGRPYKPFGASFHHGDAVFEGMDGVDIARAAYDRPSRSEERDWYDEIGHFIYPGIDAIWNEASWKKLNNEKYWDDAKRGLIDKAWECGSHPCVVGFDLSNESYHYAPYMSGKEAQDKLGQRIEEVVKALREATWPSYWCIADGDENCGNRLDFCSFHYINHAYRTYDFAKAPGGMDLDHGIGVAFYPPDGFFLNGAGEVPRKGTILHQNPDWVFGSTACGDTESFDISGDPVGTAKDLGDRGILFSAYQASDARGLAWLRLAMQGYRDMEGLTGGTYWQPMLGLVSEDVDLAMPQQAFRFYSGAHFGRRINVHDDQYAPGKLDIQWKLLDSAGKTVTEHQFAEDSTTAFLGRYSIDFDLPSVTERTTYTLDMQLRKDGKLWSHEQRRVEVWPQIVGQASRLSENAGNFLLKDFALFDPSGTVTPILEKLGQNAKKIEAIDTALLAGAKCLVVGPDCITAKMTAERDAVADFVRAGGRVLVLHQENAALLPGDINIQPRAWFSQGYVRASQHPVMKGLTDLDFQMWQPDHVICRGAFTKPAAGNVLTLVDSAHNYRDGHNVAWSEVLEAYMGKGSIVAVQLPLVDTFYREPREQGGSGRSGNHTPSGEPMAAEMFKRLLTYLGQPVYRTIDRRLAVAGPVSEAVLTRLKEVRADVEFTAKVDPSLPVTLVDLSASKSAPDAAALKGYLENGGTLILHRLRPEHAAMLESLTGKKVQVQVQPYQSWDDRQALVRPGELLESVSNLDLYWRTLIGGEGPEGMLQVSSGVPSGAERGGVIYLAKVEGAEECLFPGGLSEMRIGKGRVIVDQLKWELPETDMLCGSPTRVLSTLLTNLGVLQKLPTPRPSLPAGVTYETIDLAKLVNRGLADDKAGDGIGWADWGPDQDLRDFKTADVNLGVPFHVTPGEKNCIVLRANRTWVRSLADYPKSVTVPVGKKNVAGLWFLHTGGWTMGGAPYAWREIVYTDGSKDVIAINDTNLADWNFGRDDFPKEEVTTTTVAWKGACKSVPMTRVYKTLWVNPYPQKEIREVVLTERDLPDDQCRFVVHLAVTAAILPANAQPSAVQRDAKKSQALLQEAIALLGDNKPD